MPQNMSTWPSTEELLKLGEECGRTCGRIIRCYRLLVCFLQLLEPFPARGFRDGRVQFGPPRKHFREVSEEYGIMPPKPRLLEKSPREIPSVRCSLQNMGTPMRACAAVMVQVLSVETQSC